MTGKIHDSREWVPTADDYRLVFEEHKVGAAILEHLIRLFVQPPVTDGGIDAVLKTYMRQGSRLPLDFIAAQINRANGIDDEGTFELRDE